VTYYVKIPVMSRVSHYEILEVTIRAVGTASEKRNLSFAYTDVEFN
jgi:hypothetical protein